MSARRAYAYRQHWRTVVSAGIEDAFAFLVDPRSLPLLDPPGLDTRFVSGPRRDFGLGSQREYVFRWSRFPLYLCLRVAKLEPPRRLVLEQTIGPWQRYDHVFSLGPVQDGTEIVEEADLCAAPGVLEELVHRLFVTRHLRATAAFRRDAFRRHLGARVS